MTRQVSFKISLKKRSIILRFHNNCNYCGKLGHYAKDCRKNQWDIQQRQCKFSRHKSSIGEKGNALCVALKADVLNKEEWVTDSGATCHMSHNMEKFVVLDNDCNKEKFFLGDDTTLELIGNGNVFVEDGVFNNFMLVPNLKSNLLSLFQIANQR